MSLVSKEENVQVVRRFYDAWARDEFPGPLELMDDEIEYVNPPGAVESGTRRGLAAFK
jgi:ketosteroid isomerase-like protein